VVKNQDGQIVSKTYQGR